MLCNIILYCVCFFPLYYIIYYGISSFVTLYFLLYYVIVMFIFQYGEISSIILCYITIAINVVITLSIFFGGE